MSDAKQIKDLLNLACTHPENHWPDTGPNWPEIDGIAPVSRHRLPSGCNRLPSVPSVDTGPTWPENPTGKLFPLSTYYRFRGKRKNLGGSDFGGPTAPRPGPTAGRGRAPVAPIAKDIFQIAKDENGIEPDTKEFQKNKLDTCKQARRVLTGKEVTNIKMETQNIKTEISKGDSEIGKHDSPIDKLMARLIELKALNAQMRGAINELFDGLDDAESTTDTLDALDAALPALRAAIGKE